MVTYTGTMTGTVISVYDAGASSMEIEVVWPPFTASFASEDSFRFRIEPPEGHLVRVLPPPESFDGVHLGLMWIAGTVTGASASSSGEVTFSGATGAVPTFSAGHVTFTGFLEGEQGSAVSLDSDYFQDEFTFSSLTVRFPVPESYAGSPTDLPVAAVFTFGCFGVWPEPEPWVTFTPVSPVEPASWSRLKALFK